MTGRSGLIVGSSPAPLRAAHYQLLIREADLLIAADGGLLLCVEAGRVPDVVVGDFDSTPTEAVERAAALGAVVRRFPAVKDESDLDLALAVARELGAHRVHLTAAFSGRVDHTLAALGTLVAGADLEATADEPDWLAYALDAATHPTCELHEPAGTVLSVIAVGGVAVADADGVTYPMNGMVLPALSSHGLSNVAQGAVQRVSLTSGRAVVIVNRATDAVSLQ